MEAAHTGERVSPEGAGAPTPGDAGSTIEDMRAALAGALRKVAGRLGEADAPAATDEETPPEGVAHTSEWLNRSADYVEQVDLKGIKHIQSTFEEEVRRHPGRSLLLAGAAGVLVGFLFRRR